MGESLPRNCDVKRPAPLEKGACEGRSEAGGEGGG